MNLAIQRVALTNFRKFRRPVVLDGLSDGLNIVIEPNETGKSTLLEGLRAAFFVRHGTRNQLASSYAPHGDAVAPEVEVGFRLAGEEWHVAKRFLKSPSIEVRGPGGRAEGDEAEERLQRLLGFDRDTSRGGDIAAHGLLGMLWVGQGEALTVLPPGQKVRDSVQSTLEAEVGTMMGGENYARVRARINRDHGDYWTATGRPTGRQTAARERLEGADAAAVDAANRLDALERTLTELDERRTRMRVLEKELADDGDAARRADLVAASEVARSAAQLLHQRKAEHDAASARERALADLDARRAQAVAARDMAITALEAAQARRAGVAEELMAAQLAAEAARAALEQARDTRQTSRAALAAAEAAVAADRRRSAVADARTRHGLLDALEKTQDRARSIAATLIDDKAIAGLEEQARACAQARVERDAGATRVELVGKAGTMTLDGLPMKAGEITLEGETRIDFGPSSGLIIRPPLRSSSAAARLADLETRHDAALAELGVADLDTARRRNDAARAAAAELLAIDAQIAATTPADVLLDLSAGADALKAFVAGLPDETNATEVPAPALSELAAAAMSAETELARAEGGQDAAIDALRRIEEQDRPLALSEAGLASDLNNAERQILAIEAHADFTDLTDKLGGARADAAQTAVQLAEAERHAAAHDIADIDRTIRLIDARAGAAVEARRKLETEIARLEGVIDSEGGKGLAERAADAREEADAARAHHERVTREAAILKLLRDTLDAAQADLSRTYVGPVARRARMHIERLLPGCDLAFSNALGLDAIVRGGIAEGCTSLSRGTQEQLAILTRLGFADLLLDQGLPVSLILDDPLVYSDDGRFDIMTEILSEAAKRMQVILLTCRDRAFRHVEGHRMMIASGK